MSRNRIIEGIKECEEKLKERLLQGLTTKEAIDDMNKNLDMDTFEYVRFQELKSIASQDGRLSLDEAQTIYAMIGNCPSTFNELPVAAKVVLTQVFAVLLKK